MDSSYITSALKPEQLPVLDLPEIAVIGRSNTGKSTLLNALLMRNGLVRSGRTPGQTQLINFFKLNNAIIFADLPGYGYSKTNKDNRKHWQELVSSYVERDTLKKILFLCDVRRKLDDEDFALLDWLSRNADTKVLINKIDKLSQSEVKKTADALAKTLAGKSIVVEEILTISAMKKKGIDQLREQILALAEPTE